MVEEERSVMVFQVRKSKVSGNVMIPGSKSHTIRALFLASLAKGQSTVRNPLISSDALSAVEVCKALGAKIVFHKDRFVVDGFDANPCIPADVINVGNSGTTLRFGTYLAALGNGYSVFTGDYQVRRRPLAPLLKAINDLGGKAFSTNDNGMAPVVIKGRLRGGVTELDAVTSQFLSSVLISSPVVEKDTEIFIKRLNEIPYVDMTTWWLDKLNIKYENNQYKSFYVRGNQGYNAFDAVIPGDFSTATFFAVLAAISGEEFTLDNLNITDSQGDKLVFSILEDMGAEVERQQNGIKIKGNTLCGREIDMNSIPDALPAMAVAACFAKGETRLLNVPQARLKETDRIHVMCSELSKMGADIQELEDGLVIRESKLKGCCLQGYDDHRVVMALAVAGLNTEGTTTIDSAEAVNVTFPEFASNISNCGGDIEIKE